MASFVEKADLVYAYEFIKRICVEIGPGSPCSFGERARAAAIKPEMDKVADETKAEGFLCAPDAFLKWFTFASSLAVVAAAVFFLGLLPYAPLIFTTIGMGLSIFIVLMLVLEFILFKEFVDGLYPKKPSENIVGIIKSGNPQKSNRILIFSGHHDSALQFNYLRYFKRGYFIAEGILIVGVVIFAVGFVLRWISLAFSLPWDWLIAAFQWYTCIFLPVCVFIGFTFTERGKDGGSVPGAIDNLSAVAVILMIGRILKRHPEFQPSDTEIRLVSFGCEEAGTRGSRAYVRAHETELKAADATVINVESIYDPEIEIFTGDRNGTMKNSPEVVRRLAEAAERARVPGRIAPFPFAGGGTDALPFREKGIKAACLFSMKVPSQMMQFYHQPSDTYDKVNPAALENAVRIAVEFIRRF
jgi:Peptidase family M28